MQLPWRQQIVEGMLGADLVGFQRPVAAQNFLQICRRLVDVTPARTQIPYQGRTVRVGAFPVSIDFGEIDAIAALPERRRGRRGAARGARLAAQDPARRRPARLHQGHRRPPAGLPRAAPERRHDRRRDRARAGRDAEPRARDDVPPAARARRARRRPHQRRVRAPRRIPRSTTSTTICRARTFALLRGCRCDARDPVARRHESRLQGVRGRPPRGGGVLVLSEFAGAAGELRAGAAREPARRGRHARDDRARDRAARRPRRAGACASCAARCARTTSHRFARTFLEALAERRGERRIGRTATAARSSRRSRGLAREPHLLGRVRLRRHAGADRRRARRGAPAARVGRRAARAGRRSRDERGGDLGPLAARPRRALAAARGDPPRRQPRHRVRRRLRRARWRPRRWRCATASPSELHAIAAPRPGVTVELKPAGAALHYRQASDEDGARRATAVRAGPARAPGRAPARGQEGDRARRRRRPTRASRSTRSATRSARRPPSSSATT